MPSRGRYKNNKRIETETERWLREQRQRRAEARQAAARQHQPVDGLSPLRLPSLADELDALDARGSR